MRTIIALLILSLATSLSFAQADLQREERPTIALVLSGGAAKGMAHVGAIQVFEEQGIPIDVVAGTSAGALIGSFYAVGYSGKQIEEIIRSAGTDLNDLFFDRIDAELLRIEETRIPRQTLITLPMRNGKPTLPEGIVAGQRVQQLLTKYMWGFHQVEDFSRLPRPFICNAVDLVTGKDIALTDGFLPEAARACISLPGFFKPLEKDSLLIIDGGVSRNLPVLEAQSIGGEVLVGVDVSGDLDAEGDVQLGPEGHGNSMLFNLTKNLTIGRRAIVLDLRRELDLVVDPVTGGVSAYDFNNAWLYIQRGREAAQAMVPEIRAFLDSLGYPQPLTDIRAPSLAPVMVERIELNGVDGPARQLVERMVRFSLPQMIGPDDMDELLTRIYATDLFETVLYKMLPDPAGGPATIQMTIQPRELVNSLGVGLHYDDAYSASVLATVALRNKLRYGSTTALVLRLGRQTRASVEYFTRLSLSAPVTASASIDFRSAPLRYGSVRTGLVPDEEELRPIVQQNQLTARLGLGYALNNHTLVGVRGKVGRYIERVKEYPITDIELWYVDGKYRAANYLGAKIEGRYLSALTFLESKIFNRKAFPSKGYRLAVSAEIGRGLRNDNDLINRLDELFGQELPRSEINDNFFPFRHYTAVGEWMIEPVERISFQVDAGYSRGDGDGLPISYFTGVGGIHTSSVIEGQFFELPGLTTQKLLGKHGWAASTGVQIEFATGKFLTLKAHAGDAYLNLEDEELEQNPDFAYLDGFDLDRATMAGSIQLGLGSPLGPIRFTVAKAESNPVRLGFEIGHSF